MTSLDASSIGAAQDDSSDEELFAALAGAPALPGAAYQLGASGFADILDSDSDGDFADDGLGADGGNHEWYGLPAGVGLPSRPPRPRLVGNFVVGAKIGEGTFAVVREGIHKDTLRMVAVKVVDLRRLRKVRGGAENVKREIAVQKALKRHRNLIELIHVHEDIAAAKTYMFVEMANGCTVHELLETARDKKLPPSQVAFIIREMLSGLQYMHSRGVVHRDIKPANVMLTSSGEVKIADFGVAEFLDKYNSEDNVTRTTGSPAFQAPEIARGAEGYSGMKVDVWAVGITMYFLLVGRIPFDSDSLVGLFRAIADGKYDEPEHLGEPVCEVLRRMLDVNYQTRASVEDVLKGRWFARLDRSPSESLKASDGWLPIPVKHFTVLSSLEQVIETEEAKRGFALCDPVESRTRSSPSMKIPGLDGREIGPVLEHLLVPTRSISMQQQFLGPVQTSPETSREGLASSGPVWHPDSAQGKPVFTDRAELQPRESAEHSQQATLDQLIEGSPGLESELSEKPVADHRIGMPNNSLQKQSIPGSGVKPSENQAKLQRGPKLKPPRIVEIKPKVVKSVKGVHLEYRDSADKARSGSKTHLPGCHSQSGALRIVSIPASDESRACASATGTSTSFPVLDQSKQRPKPATQQETLLPPVVTSENTVKWPDAMSSEAKDAASIETRKPGQSTREIDAQPLSVAEPPLPARPHISSAMGGNWTGVVVMSASRHQSQVSSEGPPLTSHAVCSESSTEENTPSCASVEQAVNRDHYDSPPSMPPSTTSMASPTANVSSGSQSMNVTGKCTVFQQAPAPGQTVDPSKSAGSSLPTGIAGAAEPSAMESVASDSLAGASTSLREQEAFADCEGPEPQRASPGPAEIKFGNPLAVLEDVQSSLEGQTTPLKSGREGRSPLLNSGTASSLEHVSGEAVVEIEVATPARGNFDGVQRELTSDGNQVVSSAKPEVAPKPGTPMSNTQQAQSDNNPNAAQASMRIPVPALGYVPSRSPGREQSGLQKGRRTPTNVRGEQDNAGGTTTGSRVRTAVTPVLDRRPVGRNEEATSSAHGRRQTFAAREERLRPCIIM